MNLEMEVYLQTLKEWEPRENDALKLSERFQAAGLAPAEAEACALECLTWARCAYAGLQCVHRLVFEEEWNKENLSQGAQIFLKAVQDWKDAVKRWEEKVQGFLKSLELKIDRARLDSAYFDALGVVEWKIYLKRFFREAESFLEALSMFSNVKTLVPSWMDFYETCLKVQWYFQLFLKMEKLQAGELWLMLFDTVQLSRWDAVLSPNEEGEHLKRLKEEMEKFCEESRN